jgi:hypothetical protein
MQAGMTPKTAEDSRDFIVVPSDQVKIDPPEDELTGLLRAAARHHADQGAPAASGSPAPATPVPAVDATFRATAVNDDVPGIAPSFGRRVKRAAAALLLAVGIGGAALGWQTFGYAAKKALLSWAPKWAIAASLPLDKLGLSTESKPSEDQPDATPSQADATPAPAADAPAQNAADSTAPATVAASAAAPSSDAATAQQMQSMARDLANANQVIETLKASIAELKAGQQQMAHELAKAAEQNAKARVASATQHAAAAARKPAPVYSPTAAAAAPAYRPVPSSYSAQAAVPQATPPAAGQTYAAPVQLQPHADPELASVPRPPMPVQ